MKKIIQFIFNKRFLFILYFVIAIIASLQGYLLGGKSYTESSGHTYTKYNNYVIFEKSFEHLKNNQDLYLTYPDEHWDLYKYTPTFSVFFGFFSIFPDIVGLILWNLLNALLLFVAVWMLPNLSDKQKIIVLIICFLELLTSIQNHQSNGLVTALLILTFGFSEKRNYFLATLCIVFCAYIKLFGIVGLVLFLFYPKKWKLALYTLMWTVILFLLPLIFINVEQYGMLMTSFLGMLSEDHSASYGLSVMGWLYSWFGIQFDKKYILLIGIILFLAPLIRIRQYQNIGFRYLFLTSLLVWLVIFNHKAESPTFIIAITGVAIWFVIGNKSVLDICLLILAIIFTILSPTDIFPAVIRQSLVVPYVLKALPCILIWVKISFDLINIRKVKIKPDSTFSIQTKYNI